MTNNFKRINIWIPIIIVLGFIVVVLIENNSANNFYEKQSVIDRSSDVNIDVFKVHWNRGLLSFNGEYYISLGEFNITQKQIDNIESNCSNIKHVYKSAKSDTLKLSYSSWTESLVFR